MKECKCKDYQKNIGILDSAIMLYYTHNNRKGLKKSFIHCPYCGKKLIPKPSRKVEK